MQAAIFVALYICVHAHVYIPISLYKLYNHNNIIYIYIIYNIYFTCMHACAVHAYMHIYYAYIKPACMCNMRLYTPTHSACGCMHACTCYNIIYLIHIAIYPYNCNQEHNVICMRMHVLIYKYMASNSHNQISL